ncbi:MAG TPA: FHA domain-containing protein [Thermoanaerobaculia bacterium]
MLKRFGDCLFDSETRQLWRAGCPVPLTPKAYGVLELLLAKAPNAVSKKEIGEALWQQTFVSDSSLTNTVAEARAAIGDSARDPTFIRTVHGFGYAFDGGLTEEQADRDRPRFSAFRLEFGSQRYPLFEGENVLGRDPDAAVVLDHGSVSRRHACITVRGATVLIEDLKSRHGTFVRGDRIDSPTEIRDGDDVSLGPVTLTILAISAPGSTDSGLSG